MQEISKLQAKRAENIIWNAAQSYGFTPDFKAFDSEGQAELYWNCIIGAARKHYEYDKLARIFRAFDQYEDGETYDGLLWLGLENALYQKELDSRPALYELRRAYAGELVKALGQVDDSRFYDALALGHFRRALGLRTPLNGYDSKLLDELEFSPDMCTDDIVARAEELFQRWFQISTEEKKRQRHVRPTLFGSKKGRGAQGRRRYRFGRGFAEHPSEAYGGLDPGDKIEQEYNSKLSADELRRFMESKYGEPMYPESRMREIERELCSGSHEGCKLLFTRGEVKQENIQNAFEALHKQKEAQQQQRNRDSFNKNYARNMTEIAALSGKIQNSVLIHLRPSPVKANAGKLNCGIVWRAKELEDEKVFIKDEQGDQGDLSVDILLDASTSQKERQEAVSAQGYMIAEGLSRCGIPCRVMSFCSMTGYTILRVFRDYYETRASDRIFDYVSNGCNRDGLAIRAAHQLISETGFEHRLLIVLSDVKPNDVRKIRSRGEGEAQAYELGAGVTDTAFEVRRARADGISVVCVFTGADEDLLSAKLVYGRDLARIQHMEKFADTVGTLIQNQIKSI